MPDDDKPGPLDAPGGAVLVSGRPSSETGGPSSEKAAPAAVTRELVTEFLSKQSTRDRIRAVVEARSPRSTNAADLEDMIQDASMRAFTAEALPVSAAALRPWVSRIAQNLVIDFFRGSAKDLKWLKPGVDVQELPPDPAMEEEAEVPADDPTAPPRPIEASDPDRLHRWLREQVTGPKDRLILEMLETKARTRKTNAELALEFGLPSEGAFDKRLARFLGKWIPKWKQHQKQRRDRMLIVAALGAVVVVVVAIVIAVLRGRMLEPIGPAPESRPLPSASASAVPPVPPLDQSFPSNPPTGPK